MKHSILSLTFVTLMLVGCSVGNIAEKIPSIPSIIGGENESVNDSNNNDESAGESASSSSAYVDQGRNAPCLETANCQQGMTCMKPENQSEGTCQIVCQSDADCGNGFLCRIGGSCQKDCAEANEKCSAKRSCCFYDGNGDRVSDSVCKATGGEIDPRCVVSSTGGESVPSEILSSSSVSEASSAASSESSSAASEEIELPATGESSSSSSVSSESSVESVPSAEETPPTSEAPVVP